MGECTAMRHYFLILCILACIPVMVCGASPGDILKNQVLGLPNIPEWGYGLDTSPDGNTTVCGVAYPDDSVDLGELGNGDAWVIRFDSNGTILWEKLFGGNETDYALSVRNLPDGGAAVIGTTGSYNGDVSGYHGNGDLWFINLGPDGNIRWDQALGGDLIDEGSDIAVLPDGGYILCGYSMSSNGNLRRHLGGGDLWLVRLDKDGNILWQQTYGGSRRDSGTSVTITGDNAIVACGNTNSTDGMVSGNRTSSDVWIIKTDMNGTLLWEQSFGGSALDWGHSVIELASGDLMVAAVTASDDGDIVKNNGAGDIWLMRLAPDGTIIWNQTYGGSFSDNVWKLEPSPGGGAYLVGDSYSVDGHFAGNHGESDLLIGEVDGDGKLIWHRQIGGSSVDRGSWVKRTNADTLIVTGMTASSDGDVSGDHALGDLWILEVEGSRYENTNKSEQVQTSAPITRSPIGPLNGDGPVPTDPDGDGKYEDLNGNNEMDLQDPTVFFKYFAWLQTQEYADAFDFNENGALDLSDVQALFAEIQS
ncbi:hypothetical protein KHC33_01665 [Methanospirillum sp. J.3.6.1-F.2.7.3]|uniref:EF-hand domain-containing protein n=2 Tax=Methanospirillum purgamenti TaxID=2834276 RepID=A0A8E7AXM9_9EURY|nr:hypothetical protein [Methanospirillum sp. J.3.6.1-F.2.7.3]MDX8549446.1 hypothetical protein [Methanospirillum hungatei]QVV89270.1 hypothetical protein KHC33_01665 [Methanospirillum sp. J.3.6.1-F.2.7.3]